LVFVNNQYNIVPDFGNPVSPLGLGSNNVYGIRTKLWENSLIIDKYIKTANLNNENLKIVSSWKNFIKNDFMFIKETSKFCIMLDLKEKLLYEEIKKEKGIISSLQ